MKILFICEHNSGRSQIAEEYFNKHANGNIKAESAGLVPGTINPYVAEILAEDAIMIYDKQPRSIFELWMSGATYNAIISVCSPEVSKRCPIFPGNVLRLNWPFDDPARLRGDEENVLAGVRRIRDEIKNNVLAFLEDYESKGLRMFLEE